MNSAGPDFEVVARNAKILLVDDQHANLVVLRAILDDLGQELHEANTGEEAILRFRENDYAVVLLDVQMPGLNGFDTAQLLRQLKPTLRTPIIFLTAFDTDRETLKRAYGLGAVDFLVKPLVPVILRAKVQGFVELFQQREQLKRQAEHLRQLERIGFEQTLALENARLREERERYRVTLNSIGDAVITTDTQCQITFINPAAQSLTGWAPDAAIGQQLEAVFQIVHEHTRLPLETSVAQVLRDEHSVVHRNHTLLLAKGGAERPIDDSAAPIRSDNQTIVGVVLVFRDVTEERQALDARLRLAAIVESSDDAIISHNLEGIIVSWNRGAESLFGYQAEEVIGRPISLLVPPDLKDELPTIAAQLERGERVELYETVRLCKNGSQVYISLKISPIRNADGQVIGASRIARDISQRKRAEEAAQFLADSSAALAVLVDHESTLQKVASLAVPYFADWATVDLVASDGSLRRVAVAHRDPSKVELVRELQRRFPPDPNASYGAWNIIRSGQPKLVAQVTNERLAAMIKDPNLLGYLKTLGLRSYIGVPLNVRGKNLGAIAFIAAESARQFNEQDLLVAQELAHRVAIAMENAGLYQNLKEADRRKDEFLATLAHELRNPLAPIRSSLEILRLNESGNAQLNEVREVMQRQVQQMVRLVDDLLDVSRVSRNKLELRMERVAFATIVQNAIETSRPLIEANQHELIVAMPTEPVCVNADAVRLAQVLANLLNNSAKYTEPGGQIWVTVEYQGQDVVISVKDSGLGIPPEMLKEVFQVFVQVDRSLERSQSGLGIGLTLVQRLVEMHGGTVEAHSKGHGQGSEFIVRLPILADLPDKNEADPNGRESPVGLIARRILVVDDRRDAADTLSSLLGLLGNETRTAYDGLEAVAAADAFRPELIFLDIGLPKMNGFDVCRRIREQAWGETIVIVALTGWGQEEDRRQSKLAGFDDHMVKPVDPVALQAFLKNRER